jgi:hypothetical protein
MERFSKQEEEIFTLKIDDTAKAYMLEAGRWARFLAVIGFIIMGLFVVGGVVVGFYSAALGLTEYGGKFGVGMFALYLVFAAIYFYPVYSLFKFSSYSRHAVATNDQQQFNRSLFYLKNQFKFWGVLTILLLAIYGISIVLIIVGIATRS